MYKAIKNFEVNGRSFKIGETVPAEFVSDRLIRAKKISVNDFIKTEIKEDIKVEKVEEVILNEDKNKPYSDQKLSSLLKERGIEISRRAVAKYREELGIRGSFDRKAV